MEVLHKLKDGAGGKMSSRVGGVILLVYSVDPAPDYDRLIRDRTGLKLRIS